MIDPEAERVAHILAGCTWSRWWSNPCPGWLYWRECTHPACHGHLQSRLGMPSRSRIALGCRASWRVAAAMLTVRSVA